MAILHVHSPGSPDYDTDAEGNRVPNIEVAGLGLFFNNTSNELTDEQVAQYNLFHFEPFPESGELHAPSPPPRPVVPDEQEVGADEVQDEAEAEDTDEPVVNQFYKKDTTAEEATS